MKRLRYRRKSPVWLFLLLIFCIWAADRFGAQLDEAALRAGNGYVTLSRVVDGDTLEVLKDGRKQKVRLIGIDCPESVHADSSLNTRFGERASQFTKSVLSNESRVELRYDKQGEDLYGRILAYVYLDDGRMLNEIILEEGFAQTLFIKPNVRYQNRFERLEKDALVTGKGLWGDPDFLDYVRSKQPPMQKHSLFEGLFDEELGVTGLLIFGLVSSSAFVAGRVKDSLERKRLLDMEKGRIKEYYWLESLHFDQSLVRTRYESLEEAQHALRMEYVGNPELSLARILRAPCRSTSFVSGEISEEMDSERAEIVKL